MKAAARFPIERETVSEDIRAAQGLLAGADIHDPNSCRTAIEGAERRLAAALRKAESMGREVLDAAQEFSKARDAESLSLMQDLRAVQDDLARFNYLRTTIRVIWQHTSIERYVVETIYRRVEGKFTSAESMKAVALRDKLREDAIIAAILTAPPTEPQRPQLVGRGD